MALGTSNITMTVIRDTVDGATLRLTELCLASTINKWSKYKPVRGSFPQASDGKYGLSLVNNWEYLRPRGLAYNEGYRMGDFRGYEHDIAYAFPTIQCRQSECTLRTIYPLGNTNYYNLWTIRLFKSVSSVLITPDDLGMSLWYYGLKITVNGITYYKSKGTIAAATDAGIQITVDCTLTDSSSPAFNDLPYGSGTYTWQLILCSQQAPSWTTTVPGTVYPFPTATFSGHTLIASGTFDVANWISLSDTSMSFVDYNPDPQSALVLYTSGGVFAITNPISSWCEVEVWDDDMVVEETAHPDHWISGCFLLIKTSNNYGAQRSGTITISANGASATISISQDALYVAPIVYQINPISLPEWTVINPSWSFNGSQLTVAFTPQDLSGTSITLYIAAYRNGNEIVEDTTTGRNNYQTTKVLSLGETPPSGAQYTIYISRSTINIIPE